MPDPWFWLFVGFPVVVIVFDAYCWFLSDRPTLSQKFRDWTIRMPFLPFFVGMIIGSVAGHLWW